MGSRTLARAVKAFNGDPEKLRKLASSIEAETAHRGLLTRFAAASIVGELRSEAERRALPNTKENG